MADRCLKSLHITGRHFIPPQIRHSTVTDLARFLGVCGHVTSLREVSVHQTPQCAARTCDRHSTVTDFAKLRGLSTSVPRATAVWYASSCNGTTCSSGLSAP
jgi:tRNA U55 pseudouridine synthase TruB